MLNGFVNYDFWLPVPKMKFPGVARSHQEVPGARRAEGVDPLGYYMAPWGYAQLQVLQQAIEGDQEPRRRRSSPTTSAPTRSRPCSATSSSAQDGEWAESRVLQVQFQDIKGNDVEQFRTMGTQVVLTPAEYNRAR